MTRFPFSAVPRRKAIIQKMGQASASNRPNVAPCATSAIVSTGYLISLHRALRSGSEWRALMTFAEKSNHVEWFVGSLQLRRVEDSSLKIFEALNV
mmetsp:Transcript_24854/g.35799  ORF Transcript_24854/g.35799 Transcript_24854/m.35799 type:complete len:96 (-) Transcript_24854:964-1251(-)